MISSGVLGLVLLLSGGLLVNCQYIQDGDLPLEVGDQDITDKLEAIEHLIRGELQQDQQASPSEMAAIQWPASREDRRRLLERIASGLVRGEPQSEAQQQLRAWLYLMNGERAQRELAPLDANLRYDVDSLSPANSPDDQADVGLSRPVNDPEEFEARMGDPMDEANLNTATLNDWQQFLMELLNQTREEYELAPSEAPTSVPEVDNQISRREIDRIVDRLDHWLGQQQASRASSEEEEEEHQQQQQQQPEQQLQQRDDSEDQVGGGRAAYSGNEYIDQPLAVVGHQFVQGGAGEGRQLLGPDGTYENVQVVKTDAAIPSYCDPPNPCPLGYTAKDGCLENFVNSASFSREYQAQQKCSCDNEHSLFNCAASISSSHQDQQPGQQPREDSADESKQGLLLNLGNKLDTLARTVQNRFGNLAFVQRIIGKQQQKQEQDSIQMDNDDSNSNYLVRSARKLSALDMHHKVELD